MSSADKRSFLFLQGPQSRFFRTLGLTLLDMGHSVTKVNFCGGDVIHWPRPNTLLFRKSALHWPLWLSQRMDELGTTDLLLFGDRRPLQREAVRLAETRGAEVWVFEEGYMQPNLITFERGGVNGRSRLPRDPEGIRELAARLPECEEHPPVPNSLKIRVHDAIRHHVGNTLLFGLFPRYRTHRPYPIAWELKGWLPRYLSRERRRQEALDIQEELLGTEAPYFLFPLQLDADTQVRLYSSFSGIPESIVHVLGSFAAAAPPECRLVVKNHPLDNGLINYKGYVVRLSQALGIDKRVIFLDGGDGKRLIQGSRGVVLINSGMGLEALNLGKPVYRMGSAVFGISGLALSEEDMPLDAFWNAPRCADQELLRDFVKVLRNEALVSGNYYTDEGIEAATSGALKRLGLAVPAKGK